TNPVPRASESGRLRPGFRTSDEVKVTQPQASIEKREPTIATPTSVMVPIIHCGLSGGYGCISESPALRQKSVKFACRAISVEKKMPSSTIPARDAIFPTVKMFCTILPRLSPRVLTHVRKTMEMIASRFWRFRPTLYGPSWPKKKCHGPNVPIFHIQRDASNHGTITAVYFANAIATAAIVAV